MTTIEATYNEQDYLDELYRCLLGYQTIEGYKLDYPTHPTREDLIDLIAQEGGWEIERRARIARGCANYIQWQRLPKGVDDESIRREVGRTVDWVETVFDDVLWTQMSKEGQAV